MSETIQLQAGTAVDWGVTFVHAWAYGCHI